MELAVRYISHPAQPRPGEGTGGTHFVSFLGKTRKETGSTRYGNKVTFSG
jgi:hypothetical protein